MSVPITCSMTTRNLPPLSKASGCLFPIDCEVDRTLWAVLVGMLREAER